MLCGVNGDGKGNAISHNCLHGRYANHLSIQIHQRTTRIATVGGCICLDVLCVGPCQAQLNCLCTFKSKCQEGSFPTCEDICSLCISRSRVNALPCLTLQAHSIFSATLT